MQSRFVDLFCAQQVAVVCKVASLQGCSFLRALRLAVLGQLQRSLLHGLAPGLRRLLQQRVSVEGLQCSCSHPWATWVSLPNEADSLAECVSLAATAGVLCRR